MKEFQTSLGHKAPLSSLSLPTPSLLFSHEGMENVRLTHFHSSVAVQVHFAQVYRAEHEKVLYAHVPQPVYPPQRSLLLIVSWR